MDDRDAERLFYLGAGPAAAIVLGMALVPLRGVTTASNFTFAFLALTIVVAEFGGRVPAVATAVTSALSLDFFLTEPYLRLAIAGKHDLIAFVGLAVCGLIAAALGSRRGHELGALGAVEKHRDLLRSMLAEWDGAAPAGPQLEQRLRTCLEMLPLEAIVLRDVHECALAATGASAGLRPVPQVVLLPDTLLPAGGPTAELGRGAPPLPERGGRIPLFGPGRRPLGWLDVWGNGAPAGVETRRALSDVARLLAVLLAVAGTPSSRA